MHFMLLFCPPWYLYTLTSTALIGQMHNIINGRSNSPFNIGDKQTMPETNTPEKHMESLRKQYPEAYQPAIALAKTVLALTGELDQWNLHKNAFPGKQPPDLFNSYRFFRIVQRYCRSWRNSDFPKHPLHKKALKLIMPTRGGNPEKQQQVIQEKLTKLQQAHRTFLASLTSDSPISGNVFYLQNTDILVETLCQAATREGNMLNHLGFSDWGLDFARIQTVINALLHDNCKVTSLPF